MPDAPDWITDVQVNVVVKNVPIPPEPTKECAAGGVGNYSGHSDEWQEVVSWTVDDDKVGELKEILIITDDYDATICKVTVGSVIWAPEVKSWSPTSAMPIIFEDLKLAEKTIVKVEVKSDGATDIDVDAIIVAKEIG